MFFECAGATGMAMVAYLPGYVKRVPDQNDGGAGATLFFGVNL
jgi:hypothetical protein